MQCTVLRRPGLQAAPQVGTDRLACALCCRRSGGGGDDRAAEAAAGATAAAAAAAKQGTSTARIVGRPPGRGGTLRAPWQCPAQAPAQTLLLCFLAKPSTGSSFTAAYRCMYCTALPLVHTAAYSCVRALYSFAFVGGQVLKFQVFVFRRQGECGPCRRMHSPLSIKCSLAYCSGIFSKRSNFSGKKLDGRARVPAGRLSKKWSTRLGSPLYCATPSMFTHPLHAASFSQLAGSKCKEARAEMGRTCATNRVSGPARPLPHPQLRFLLPFLKSPRFLSAFVPPCRP